MWFLFAALCFAIGLWPFGLAVLVIGVMQGALRRTPDSVTTTTDPDGIQRVSGTGVLLLLLFGIGGVVLLLAGAGASVTAIDPQQTRAADILRAIVTASQ